MLSSKIAVFIKSSAQQGYFVYLKRQILAGIFKHVFHKVLIIATCKILISFTVCIEIKVEIYMLTGLVLNEYIMAFILK